MTFRVVYTTALIALLLMAGTIRCQGDLEALGNSMMNGSGDGTQETAATTDNNATEQPAENTTTESHEIGGGNDSESSGYNTSGAMESMAEGSFGSSGDTVEGASLPYYPDRRPWFQCGPPYLRYCYWQRNCNCQFLPPYWGGPYGGRGGVVVVDQWGNPVDSGQLWAAAEPAYASQESAGAKVAGGAQYTDSALSAQDASSESPPSSSLVDGPGNVRPANASIVIVNDTGSGQEESNSDSSGDFLAAESADNQAGASEGMAASMLYPSDAEAKIYGTGQIYYRRPRKCYFPYYQYCYWDLRCYCYYYIEPVYYEEPVPMPMPYETMYASGDAVEGTANAGEAATTTENTATNDTAATETQP